MKDDEDLGCMQPFSFEAMELEDVSIDVQLSRWLVLTDEALEKVIRFVKASWRGERLGLVISGEMATGKSRLLDALRLLCAPGTVLLDYDAARRVGPGWRCLAMVRNGMAPVFPRGVEVLEVEMPVISVDVLKAAGVPLIFK